MSGPALRQIASPILRAVVVVGGLAAAMLLGSFNGSLAQSSSSTRAEVIVAGGCFWCVESDFDKVRGVISTTSGYTAGSKANPTYQEVSAGGTGHTEAVKIVYDPTKVTFAQLVEIFWRNIDPVTPNAQFCDHGTQYRSAIFYSTSAERAVIEKSKAALEATGRLKAPIVTQVAAASTFYPAEDYHQDFATKSPAKYKFYRWNCGRDQRLKALWGDEAGFHGS
jgi:peptide-methionine (S)-S-oxide reductase